MSFYVPRAQSPQYRENPYFKPENRLFLTGASGLLGRAIQKHFINLGWKVYGTALTRATPPLQRLDLTNEKHVQQVFEEFRPAFLIHCAAQRYPEKVDNDFEAAKLLNYTATIHLASLCANMGVTMIYISTDYVFDGKTPPYSVDHVPNPINMYGQTKRMGETAALSYRNNMVLRIPVLYGPVEKLSESAITCLLDILMTPHVPTLVSDYEKRRPSHVDDVAKICQLLVEERQKNPLLNGIFHWCGQEEFTKYGMLKTIARVFDLPCDHVSPTTKVPHSSTARPHNTTLDISRIQAIFNYRTLPFETLIYNTLLPWVNKFRKPIGNSP